MPATNSSAWPCAAKKVQQQMAGRRRSTRRQPAAASALLLLLCGTIVTLVVSSCLIQVAAAAAAAADTYAYFAYVNDVHNRLEEEEPLTATPCQPATKAEGRCVGGWPRIATQIKALRLQAARERAGFFFLDAVGCDEFTGSLWDIVYQGQVTAKFQNKVKVDVMTIGNHEFDFGPQMLAYYIRNLTAPMLGACNVDSSAEPALQGLLKKWHVLEYAGRKIAVLGWLTPDTAITSLSYGNTKFAPVTPSVTACLAQLKQERPDLDYIIGLSHAGYTSDLETAEQVAGLDMIIGGHSHTFLYTPTAAGPIVTRKPGVNASNCVSKSACDKPVGPYPTYVGNVPVVQAYYSSKYMGLLKVNLSKRRLESAKLLLLGGTNSSNNVQQDPALLSLLKQYEGPVVKMQSAITGRTLVPLEGDPSISRKNETNLGNYLCEALLQAVPPAVAQQAGGEVLCLMNAGGMRSGLPTPGDITVGQVWTMLPYANAIAIFSVTGASLLAALKNGLSAYPSGGRFLQVSQQLRYFHSNGKYLSAVLVDKEGSTKPINPSKTYTIVATDYMLQGGDGFNFSGADVLLPSGQTLQEAMMAALKAALPQGISPTTHSRIINCALTPSFPGCPGSTGSGSSSSSSLAATRNTEDKPGAKSGLRKLLLAGIFPKTFFSYWIKSP